MSNYKIVIPARLESTRFPGKALVDIDGKPMVQHVYERAQKTEANEVVIATDDSSIVSEVERFGGTVRLTDPGHQSGTDRIAEVVTMVGWEDETIVVNVQGDEPLIPPEIIDQVATNLAANTDADCATLCAVIDSKEEIEDPNIVKVVSDARGMALYFSRSVIPHLRDSEATDDLPIYFRHIGLYAYRANVLKQFTSLDPCRLEQQEKLEQLRLLYNGFKIHVDLASNLPGPGIDTPADLERLREILALETQEV